MKFKTKKDLLREPVDFPTSMYNRGIGEAFNSFAERVGFFEKYMLSGMRFLSKEEPEVFKDYLDYCKGWNENKVKNLSIYTNWLFNYCFGDIE